LKVETKIIIIRKAIPKYKYRYRVDIDLILIVSINNADNSDNMTDWHVSFLDDACEVSKN